MSRPWTPPPSITTTSCNIPVVRVGKAVGFYGGFAGTEAERSQRDWVDNEIIISAVLDGSTIRGSTSAAGSRHHAETPRCWFLRQSAASLVWNDGRK